MPSIPVGFLVTYFVVMSNLIAPQNNRSVCWIQNAGFFIDLPDGDILVDAILSSNDAIARAEAPYDDVRLIFVSHVHGDHFKSEGILRHLRSNRKAKAILTPESFQSLRSAGLSNELETRIVVSYPDADEFDEFEIDGFSGHVLQFKHAGVQNIGLGLTGKDIDLVYLNGGIQNRTLRDQMSENYAKTDIVIANKWPLKNAAYANQVEELFSPSLLLMAHHSGSLDEIVRENGGVSEMEKKMGGSAMKGKVFERRMQCESF
ncbi:MAG: MBL fold metallo-hydrolase [Cyclobacteriaceae bacterium]